METIVIKFEENQGFHSRALAIIQACENFRETDRFVYDLVLSREGQVFKTPNASLDVMIADTCTMTRDPKK